LDKTGDVSSWGVGNYIGMVINMGLNTIQFVLNGVNVGPLIKLHHTMLERGAVIYPVIRMKPKSTVCIVGGF